MHPFKRKFVTSTFLMLIFFYFPKSINGDIESGTCDAKNACVKHDKLQSKIFFEPQLLERETRMMNVRDRVGSEKLVNNRRIVDSDSRISDDIRSRNVDFPRLAQSGRALSHDERTTNGRNVPENQIRRDTRSARRALLRDSRAGESRIRDSRDVRLVEDSRRVRRGYDESRRRNSQDRQLRILERSSPERESRNTESTVRLTRRVERRDDSRRVRSVDSRFTRPSVRVERREVNERESQIDQRTMNRESRERIVRLSDRVERQNLERVSRQRNSGNREERQRNSGNREERERNENRSRVSQNSMDSRLTRTDNRLVRDDRVMRDRLADDVRKTTRNLDERITDLRSRERRIVEQERRTTGERQISDISRLSARATRRLSSDRSVDINNNVRVTDKRALDDHQPATFDGYVSQWSNLLTTAFGILILIQIVTTSNTKKYGIPKLASFLHGVKEKVY